LTCAEVEERDLEAAYLAGRLDDATAEAYEAHYFGCDRCWSALRRAQEIRGALVPRPAGVRQWQRPLAVAAGVALLVAAGWWATLQRRPGSGDTLRGAGDSLVVQLRRSPGGALLVWPAWTGADRYRVRAYDANGVLLAEREAEDTTMELTIPPGAAFVDVTALDLLREPLVGSGLVRVPPAP
jgi:hypothetical protein